MNLRKLPEEERPRERLSLYGAEALSLSELLAILLTTGTKGKSVLDLAQELIETFQGLDGLLSASLEELMGIRGLGKAKAIQLKAAFALALRSQQRKPVLGTKISSTEAYELVREEMSIQTQEILIVILKDVKGRLIGQETVSIGTLSQVLIHPREVFFPAVRRKASSLILAHNHPSGDPMPSKADLELTLLLQKSGKVMGITLEDHLIIGRGSYRSLKEMGAI